MLQELGGVDVGRVIRGIVNIVFGAIVFWLIVLPPLSDKKAGLGLALGTVLFGVIQMSVGITGETNNLVVNAMLPVLALLCLVCLVVVAPKIRKRLMDEVEHARKAEVANTVKTEFLRTMSHELRTPLTAVIGYAEILHDGVCGELTSEQQEQVRRIQESGTHLVGLVNQIMDFTKLESGDIALQVESVNVGRLAQSCIALVQPACEAGKVILTVDVQPALIVQTDPGRLRQIILNLLVNAVKYTPHGRISLLVTHTHSDVEIRVTDTGIGISEEDLPKIFDRFWQAKPTKGRAYGGTGLGLAIAKRLSEALGGELTCTSKVSSGTTFTLTLPRGVHTWTDPTWKL